ncbi:hypothetical protein PQX77_015709 [Marasmius sp. AFHP31]|nr:hypothetical protein PQX77_015709 [Marasmius sp. AFHP31]
MRPRSFHNTISACFGLYNLGSAVLHGTFTVSSERQLHGLCSFWNAGKVGRLPGGNQYRERVTSVNIGFFDGRHVRQHRYLRLDLAILCDLLATFPNVSSMRIEQVELPVSILRSLIQRWPELKTLEARYFKTVSIPPVSSSMLEVPLTTCLERVIFLPGSSRVASNDAKDLLVEIFASNTLVSCVIDWITLDRVLRRKSDLRQPRHLKTLVLAPPSPWLETEGTEPNNTSLDKLGWWNSGRSTVNLVNFRTYDVERMVAPFSWRCRHAFRERRRRYDEVASSGDELRLVGKSPGKADDTFPDIDHKDVRTWEGGRKPAEAR